MKSTSCAIRKSLPRKPSREPFRTEFGKASFGTHRGVELRLPSTTSATLPTISENRASSRVSHFIVDRVDLLDQASREFLSRGLNVYHISSREAFAEDIKLNVAVHNDSGTPEITVVNIQRFANDPFVDRSTDYGSATAGLRLDEATVVTIQRAAFSPTSTNPTPMPSKLALPALLF